MSREIKFRGKRIDNGEWIYGYFRKVKHDCAIITVPILSNGHHIVSKDYVVDDDTVGQFTSIKDKNGKEIWESDTVLSEGIYYEVYQHPSGDWQAGGLSIWEQSGEYSEDNEWKVVGNVFDNPELMEDNYES